MRRSVGKRSARLRLAASGLCSKQREAPAVQDGGILREIPPACPGEASRCLPQRLMPPSCTAGASRCLLQELDTANRSRAERLPTRRRIAEAESERVLIRPRMERRCGGALFARPPDDKRKCFSRAWPVAGQSWLRRHKADGGPACSAVACGWWKRRLACQTASPA